MSALVEHVMLVKLAHAEGAWEVKQGKKRKNDRAISESQEVQYQGPGYMYNVIIGNDTGIYIEEQSCPQVHAGMKEPIRYTMNEVKYPGTK